MKHIQHSPINKAPLSPFLKCKDHSLSREDFTILIDKQAQLLITTPRPDDDDLARYYESESYISHTDSSSTLMDRLYKIIRRISLKKKLNLINSFQCKKRTILDIGAGTGDFLLTCKNNGWHIVGVEPNLKARTLAEKKNETTFYESISGLKAKTFDVITMWHVLEHMPDLEQTMQTAGSLLNQGGTLVIAVPNFNSYDANYYGKFWAAYDVPRHLWHFSKKAMEQLARNSKMKVDHIMPLKFDAYYVSMLSEKYKNGRNNFLQAFLVGLRSNLSARTSKEYSSLIYIIKKA